MELVTISDGQHAPGEGHKATREHIAAWRARPRYYARCARNNEPWWSWRWGKWRWDAGAFPGLGLSLVLQADELTLIVGPFAIGGSRG